MDKVAAAWAAYRARGVDPVIHTADHMWNTGPRIDDYNFVGESGVRVISSVLAAAATKESVWRILDFGCGHGRVARHIRALFPQAELFFCDIDYEAAQFCADRFGGTSLRSSEDLTQLDLPVNMDLVWVGSVFTHIDYRRMQILFDNLFASLGRGGVLTATFRGRRTHEVALAAPDQAELWRPLHEQYEREGVGYQSYGRPELGDWGLSLCAIEKVIALGHKHSNARLVGYTEAGWANIHDVASWMKL